MTETNIIGAGGLGSEVKSMLPHCGFQFQGYFDDDRSVINSRSIKEISSSGNYVIAIGNPDHREELVRRLPAGITFPNLIHSMALFQDKESIKLGYGNIITAGTILTCNITIGNFCIINLNCTIGHDVRIGSYCSIMPSTNLGGNVILHKGAYIGTGATILPGIEIGENAIIGAGAVVTRNVQPGITVKGIPAK